MAYGGVRKFSIERRKLLRARIQQVFSVNGVIEATRAA